MSNLSGARQIHLSGVRQINLSGGRQIDLSGGRQIHLAYARKHLALAKYNWRTPDISGVHQIILFGARQILLSGARQIKKYMSLDPNGLPYKITYKAYNSQYNNILHLKNKWDEL